MMDKSLKTMATLALVAAAGLWAYGVRPWQAETTGASTPIPPGKAASRIAILGTSLTARGSWVAELEGDLRRCNPEAAVTALARPGANSSWGLTALQSQQMPFDIVIVEFSINDASLFHGMPLILSRDRHRQILAAIRDTGAMPVLATMSPAWGREAWERPGQASYRQMYRELARNDQMALIDTAADWFALAPGERTEMVPDNLHPTAQAMQKVTIPAFLTALRPAVCGPSG